MTAEAKAKELINMYYDHSKSQKQAIDICENVVLTTLCQKIDSLHDHVFHRKDFGQPLMESAIKHLKWWQEVASELQKLKDKLPVN